MPDRSPSYRVEPDVAFADRLERVLVLQLTAPAASAPNLAPRLETRPDTDGAAGHDGAGRAEESIELADDVGDRTPVRRRFVPKILLGVAAAAVLVVALALIARIDDHEGPADVPSSTIAAPTPITVPPTTSTTTTTTTTTTPPPDPFVGVWSSIDTDGSSQTMQIDPSGIGAYEVVIRDDEASGACAGGPSTITGAGQLAAQSLLVMAAPSLTCDDGSIGRLGPPPQAELADFTLELDPTTGEIVDRFDVVWQPTDDELATSMNELIEDEGFAPLGAGTYTIDPDGDAATSLSVTYEVPAGWSSWLGATRFYERREADAGARAGHVAISITTITNVVRHGCTDHRPADPVVGPTVDDLATALAGLAPFQLPSPPRPVSVFGYDGSHLRLTVPQTPTVGDAFGGCDDASLHSWFGPLNGGSFYGYNAEPGRVEEFWILDVDGSRLVIATNWAPGSPDEAVAEMRGIFDSIRIEP